MHRLVAATLFAVIASPLIAQTDTCAYRDQIVTASWDILEARSQIDGLRGHRVGEDAAYLILRYDDPASYLQGDVWLALGAGRRAHPMMSDMILTYTIWRAGAELALALEADPVARILTSTWSPRRAVILADEGQTYLRLANEAAERDDIEDFYTAEPSFSQHAAHLVIDQSDAFKQTFAAHADAAGRPLLAALLLADTSDPDAYFAYFEALEEGVIQDFARRPEQSGLTVFHGTGPLHPRPGNEGFVRALEAPLYLSPADFLLISINQTGDEAGIVAAIDALEVAVAAGELDPLTDMDRAWLIAFDAWVAASGAELVTRTMSSFVAPPTSVRHYADRVSVTLAGMAGAARLGPYAAGAGDSLPEPHPHLPYLEGWAEVAEAMRSGARVSVEQATIAAELFWAVGNVDGALIQAARLDPKDRARVLTDLIKRMDRSCDAATYAPMQALTLGGGHFWDFPHN